MVAPVPETNLPDVKKVMISSTALDLPDHREQVRDACLRQGMFPLMMEHLPASDAEAIAESLRMVNEADLYLGVFAYRYGYVPKGYDISITEMEYNRAVERGIPRLLFLMHEKHPLMATDVEKGEGATKLAALKARLKTENIVNAFQSPAELQAQVINSLSRYRQPNLTAVHYVSDIPATPSPVQVPQQQPASLGTANPSNQTPQVISKKGAPDAMKATTDKAVRSIAEDKLGFSVWVKALRNFIISPDTTTPLTISIEGPWGTGKTSFMYMLKDLLEPSISFWERIRKITLPWLVWLIKFVFALPVWIIGKVLVWGGRNISRNHGAWYQDINDSLSYDPEIDEDIDLEKLSKHKRYWARAAARHCPRQPATYPTIWFNAWKFDQEEQLWAALALAVLDQIKEKQNLVQRIVFWFELTFKRFSPGKAIYQISIKIALPILLGLLAWNFDVAFKLAVGTYHGNLNNLSGFIPLGQSLLWVGAGISGILQITSIIKDPFQIPIKDVFDKPNYKEKVGFIGSFERDFAAIVSIITKSRLGWKPRKLIIFIDDLDRCKLPKAVDIIEGINLFLDSEQCVFVVGMEMPYRLLCSHAA